MSDRWLTPEQAERLWKRAAELQAEGARRLEESHGPGDGPGEQEGEGRDPLQEGYALEHVRHAAAEAGIGEDFLRRALAEMDAGGMPEPRRTSDRVADLFLGDGPRTLGISRTFDAPAERVYATLQELVPSEAYPLRLVDTQGPHPLDGGVLLFEVPPVQFSEKGFSYEVRGWADIRQVLLSLERLDEERTVVTMRAPLAHSRRVTTWVGGGLSGTVSGLLGAVAGGSVAAVLSPAVSPLLIPLVGVAAAGGTFTGVGWGLARLWRPLYRYSLDRARTALEAILQDIHVRLRLGDRAMPAGQAPPLPPAPSPSDGTAASG